MEPSIHEPALLQTVKEQFDNHNDFVNYLQELYNNLAKYYSFLEQIEYRTKELWRRIQEHFKYKYSARGVANMYEAKNDAENMLGGICFLKNLFEKISYRFMVFQNPQTNNIYCPVGNYFVLNKFRKLPDPILDKTSIFNKSKKE